MILPPAAWESFAEREPFFAALPRDEYRRANLTPEGEAACFASGEAEIDRLLRAIAPLAPSFAPVSALDYGCGIGRLTIPLAQRIRHVTAVDVSPTLLAHAGRESARRGVDHITFLAPAAFERTAARVDLIVCHRALWRLSAARGLALVDDLVSRLAPGGLAVFTFPYKTSAPAAVRALRWLRERVPFVNGIVNRLRGKAADEPFFPTRAYNLYAVLERLERAGSAGTHLFVHTQEVPPTATVVTRAPLVSALRRPDRNGRPDAGDTGQEAAAPAGASPGLIDVRDVIASTTIEELNRRAEEYFATLTDWDHHLAKPFARIDEAPPLLIDVAVLLQGLDLAPGMHVLEFGAGSGWLSRWLTQLGCRVTLVDVSPTALGIARELYQRQPVIGDRPAPAYLPFDGRRIDCPDASVDRVICFHAFHHAANPDDILREFGRVLAPGGIAAFAEPGPGHSRTALSQFEMRTYGVVENDVDLHAVWATARAAGFADLTLAVYHQPPFHVPLERFEDLLTGGETNDAWAAETRGFLRNFRCFFLSKQRGRRDSRGGSGLACRIAVEPVPQAAPGDPLCCDAVVTNSGSAVWLSWPSHGGVALGAHLYDEAAGLVNFDFHCEALTSPSREIGPGETVRVRVALPVLAPGRHRLEFDCVASGVTWFAQTGSRPAVVTVEVR